MSGLDSRGGLAVADLIFYIPTLPLALYICVKHGFGRTSGFLFLVILALIRIIGSLMEIALETSTPTQALQTGALVLSAIGLSPLLLAALGLLQRINASLGDRQLLPELAFRILALPAIIGLILSIVAGMYIRSSAASTAASGVTCRRIAVILFALAWLIIAGTAAVFVAASLRHLARPQRILLWTVAAAVPLLAVRVLYSVLGAFVTDTVTFSPAFGNVVVEAFMVTLEEFLVVIFFLAAGFVVPKAVAATEEKQGRYAGPPKPMYVDGHEAGVGRMQQNEYSMRA